MRPANFNCKQHFLFLSDACLKKQMYLFLSLSYLNECVHIVVFLWIREHKAYNLQPQITMK